MMGDDYPDSGIFRSKPKPASCAYAGLVHAEQNDRTTNSSIPYGASAVSAAI